MNQVSCSLWYKGSPYDESSYRVLVSEADTVSSKNLVSQYNMDDVPEIPNDPTGTTYFQDAWATVDGWHGNGATSTLSLPSAGIVRSTVNPTKTELYFLKDATLGSGGTVRIRIKPNVTMPVQVRGTIAGVANTILYASTPAIGGEWKTISCSFTGACTRLFIQAATSEGNYLDLDWIYIGTGAYLPNSLVDRSGNGNHGTIYGATPLADGGFSFDGNDTITIPDFSSTAHMSFVFSFEANDEALLNRYIFQHPAFIIHYRRTFSDLTQIYLKQGGVYSSARGNTIKISAGEKCHVVFTYDGISIKWYENGMLMGTSPLSGTIDSLTGSLVIGTGAIGTLHNSRIYNRALSAREIEIIYNEHQTYKAHLCIHPETRLLGFSEGNSFTPYSDDAIIEDNKTYHICLLMDGANYDVVLNGKEVASAVPVFDVEQYPPRKFGNYYPSTMSFEAGLAPSSTLAPSTSLAPRNTILSNTTHANGWIDEIHLFSRILTISEINGIIYHTLMRV